MADYFEEMGVEGELEEADESDPLLHYARLLRDFGMYSLLSEDKRLPPPVSKEFFKSLKKETVEFKEIDCPICLREPKLGDIMTVLPCSHKYHSDCISPWLERTSTCPVCRLEMPTDDHIYEVYRKEKLRAKRREEEIKALHNSMFS